MGSRAQRPARPPRARRPRSLGGLGARRGCVTSVDVGVTFARGLRPSPSAWGLRGCGGGSSTSRRLGASVALPPRSQPRHQVLGHARRGGLARHPHLLQRPQQLLAGDPELLPVRGPSRLRSVAISSISLPTSFGRRPIRNALPSTPARRRTQAFRVAMQVGTAARRGPGRIDRRSRRSRDDARESAFGARARARRTSGRARAIRPSLRRRRLLGLLDLRGSLRRRRRCVDLGGRRLCLGGGRFLSAVDLDAVSPQPARHLPLAGTASAARAATARVRRPRRPRAPRRRPGSPTDVDAPAGQPRGQPRSGPPSRSRVRVGSPARSPWPCRALVDADLP